MGNSDSSQIENKDGLAEDLVGFYDEFTEFQAYCAFLCDALSAMVNTQMDLDDATRRGMCAFSGQLKCRIAELKISLKRIQQKSFSSE